VLPLQWNMRPVARLTGSSGRGEKVKL